MSKKRRSRLGSKRELEDGRWLVRVRKGKRRDGRPREISRVVQTEKEADLEISRLAIEMGANPNLGDEITLTEYYELYFVPKHESYCVNATMARYEGSWKRCIKPKFGDRDMASIRHAEVQTWLMDMTHSEAKHCATTLRAILRSAWDDNFLMYEPMRHRLRFPKNKERPVPVWSADEVAAAMPLMEGIPIEALWLVMVGGGCRREEAYALFWHDLTFEFITGPDDERICICYAVIDDAVTLEDGRKETKTLFSERVIVIADPFASRLYDLRPDNLDEPLCKLSLIRVPKCWGSLWEPKKVKTDGNGKYYRGRMLDEEGIPKVRKIHLYRMRATHETLMQQTGTEDTVNSRVHGRSSVNVGYRHYLMPDDSTTIPAAIAVGNAVKQKQLRNVTQVDENTSENQRKSQSEGESSC